MAYTRTRNNDFLVDYRVFKKSPIEKAEAHTVKKQWQATMKMFFGADWKKHNNYPETLKA